jgi:GDP-L-fucose synthase
MVWAVLITQIPGSLLSITTVRPANSLPREICPLAFLNVGTGVDLTIKELAEQIAAVVGFKGTIEWDTSKPDGTPKKQLEVSRMQGLGWRARVPLPEGLKSTFALFQ